MSEAMTTRDRRVRKCWKRLREMGGGEVLKELEELIRAGVGELREQNGAMEGEISELKKKLDEASGEICRLNAIEAACTCRGVPQAPAQAASPVTGNGGMHGQGQGQGTMLQVTDQQDGISNKNKKEKKIEPDIPVNEKNTLSLVDGELSVSNIQLGVGSNGTIVYKGMWNRRAVAVKRLPITCHKLASDEIVNYIASSQHTNVVTYYGVHSDENYYYLALELCSNTLHDLILSSSSGKKAYDDPYMFDEDEDDEDWYYHVKRNNPFKPPFSPRKQDSEVDQDKGFQLRNKNTFSALSRSSSSGEQDSENDEEEVGEDDSDEDSVSHQKSDKFIPSLFEITPPSSSNVDEVDQVNVGASLPKKFSGRSVSQLRNSVSQRRNSNESLIMQLLYPRKQVSENGQDKVFKLWNDNGDPSTHLMKLIGDMVLGLIHLHQKRILHRDLKPSNILILKEGESICAKLSDMGISKRLEPNASWIKSTTPPGHQWSPCWQASEQLRGHSRKLTPATDIFSLGCVIFFCITKGNHPFGKPKGRNDRILKNQKDLKSLEKFPEAYHLVDTLLNPLQKMRPRAEEILDHPFFWDSTTRLEFIEKVNRYLKSTRKNVSDITRKNVSDIKTALEKVKKEVFDDNWDTNLEHDFVKDLSKPVFPDGSNQYYDCSSFWHLLRTIRDKWEHYKELSESTKKIVRDTPEDYYGYFSSKFPNLLVEVYKIFYKYCKEEADFKKYFKGNQEKYAL